jgi:hypothetical protein
LLEIADHLERTFEERQALERRLAEVLEENKILQQRCVQANAEHVRQCNGLQAEIANLRLQANEMLTRLEKIAAVERRQDAESSAKERLIRDEQERKIQALQLELKNERSVNEKRIQQERSLNEKRMQQMEARLANCICGDIQIEYDGQPARNRSSQTKDRWAIRNSK